MEAKILLGGAKACPLEMYEVTRYKAKSSPNSVSLGQFCDDIFPAALATRECLLATGIHK